MGASVKGGCSATPAREMRLREMRAEERSRRTPFTLMTIAELRTWAQKFDVRNYGKLKKDELAEEVRVAFERGR